MAEHEYTAPRRAFLCQLIAVPLMAASASIAPAEGAPEPASWQLLTAYKTWLQNELRGLCWTMSALPEAEHHSYSPIGDRIERSKTLECVVVQVGVGQAAIFPEITDDPTNVGKRAVAVMTAVGCDWRA